MTGVFVCAFQTLACSTHNPARCTNHLKQLEVVRSHESAPRGSVAYQSFRKSGCGMIEMGLEDLNCLSRSASMTTSNVAALFDNDRGISLERLQSNRETLGYMIMPSIVHPDLTIPAHDWQNSGVSRPFPSTSRAVL